MRGSQPDLFPLSDIEVIAEFLAREGSEDSVSVSELDGFLTAVVIGPELIPPSEWLPLAFGDELPAFENQEQAQRVLGAVMARYNEIIHSLNDDPPTFAPVLWESTGEWAVGFMIGVGLREKAWRPFLRLRRHQEMMAPIFALLPEAAEELGDMPISELKELVDAAAYIPACVWYADAHWKRKRAMGGVSVHELKVGRNEPCPCGSAKKFKKCCGGAAAAA